MADAVSRIFTRIESVTGIVVRADKRPGLTIKLWRRARALGLSSLEEYARHIDAHSRSEAEQLVSIVTTHVTSFFREPAQFDYLAREVLPGLLATSDTIRFWSAACSTGEEVYSLAIAVLEALKQAPAGRRAPSSIQIIGTDIDPVSVARARNGVYKHKSVEHLSPALVRHYFDLGQEDLAGMVRIGKQVHEMCTFGVQDLLARPYGIRVVDVIFLRNVLIYFSPSEIDQTLTELRSSLNAGGHLFLGAAEDIDEKRLGFQGVAHCIYRLQDTQKVNAERPRPVRVVTVDDSKLIRSALRGILCEQHGFLIAGEAEDPIVASAMIAELKPDVVTLDINMPRQTGIEYLEALHGKPHPPIVMLSTVRKDDADGGLKCIELGAFDYLEKPERWSDPEYQELLRGTLRNAARPRPKSAHAPTASTVSVKLGHGKRELIVLGASTGGVEALRMILQELPKNAPPVVVVQHLPAAFTSSFAARLNRAARIPIHESTHGGVLERGHAYIAMGGLQTRIVVRKGRLQFELLDDPPVNRHRPSVDYLFESVARLCPMWRISAALLTGMGNDGANGLKLLRDAGAHTIAESEETAVVFGMPKEAITLGAAKEVLPLGHVLVGLLKPFQARASDSSVPRICK